VEDYERYDALGLAALVRRGEVTPAGLCEAAIRRAEALDPRLNAIVTPLYDRAREAAAGPLPDGPFTGVPFLLKNLLHASAGVPLTSGSAALRDHVAAFDAEVVRRFRRAGLVTIGTSSVPELGLLGITEPEAHGPSRNPWDPSRTPGGSSGGAAAAVAAGIVPLASATDGGGSIRIPAAYCGLFGLKPSRGRVPAGPAAGEVWDGAVVDHAVTRSVRDSAALLDAIAGADPGAPFVAAPPERPYAEEVARDPGRLRIGFTPRSPLGGPVHPDCAEAARHTAALLEEMGHHVEEAEPEVDGAALARCYLTLVYGQVAADLAEIRRLHGRAAARRVEAGTRAAGMVGRAMSAGEYVESRRRWNDFGRAMARFHERYDLWLTPTTAQPPAAVGELAIGLVDRVATGTVDRLGAGRILAATGLVEKLALRNLARTPFTQLANLTGQPAMSVPVHWTADGLPVGTHFTAPVGGEGVLFRLAARLEEAAPWAHRLPAPLPPTAAPRAP
jgi:amidase